MARLVARLVAQPAPWVITLDRTDWYLGETPLNVLLLGVAHEGVTFPLLWAVLPKKGCCDTAERIALLDEYLRVFGRSSLRFLCADREFLGLDRFSYLRREGVSFRHRVRANTLVTNGRGLPVQARRLFRQGRVGEVVLLKGARRVLGQRLFVMGVRLPKGEYVIVCAPEESEALLEDYARRWKVETLHRPGEAQEAGGAGGAGLPLGARGRRVAGAARAAAAEEARAQGYESVPSRVLVPAAHTMRPAMQS